MDTLKTLYNVGLNTDTSGSMPKYDVIEKGKVNLRFLFNFEEIIKKKNDSILEGI